ncbi:hypothetical protein K1T71_008023 [Dendrolimus kikuchii]|uniref:Uncharacterized protein n=1 Tax=Dendrolimus kikuchii TaxID=765133 RepID=A0ACC1CZD7_9NEOP|nr:hypothetical protein K1T71_008023 [Dendrolimus kikuchii]
MNTFKVKHYKHLTFLFFLSFINNILAKACNFDVKVKQILLNEGFHRNITYGIHFDTENNANRWFYKDCIVGLDQLLPAGVYANPDELSDLRRMGKLNALPKNPINIELPTEQSEPSGIYILGKLSGDRVDLWIPVHARYHQAVTGGGTARNEIEAPTLYIRCPDQRLDMCEKHVSKSLSFLCNGGSKEQCSWRVLPYTMLTDTLIWNVPVGDLNQYYLVGIGTGLVVVVGSLYLLNTIHEYNLAAKRKRL